MNDKTIKSIFDQGKTIPPSGRGVGLLLIFVGLLPAYFIYEESNGPDFNHLYCALPVIVGIWMNLATTQIDFSEISKGIIIHRFGIFPLKFSRKTHLKKFDAAVLKPVRQRYVVSQGMAFGSINNPEYSEHSFGLYFKPKGKFEEELIMKGKGNEVIDLTKKHLIDSHLRIFMGVIKKGFEINWEAQSK